MNHDLKETFELLSHESTLRYFAKRGEVTTGGEVHSVEQLTAAATALASFDFYVNLNPSIWVSTKAKASDITALRWMVFDLDPVAVGGALLAAEHLVAAIYAVVGVDTPFVTIFSGRGMQHWMPIRGAELATSATWSHVLKRITYLVGVEFYKRIAPNTAVLDLSCADISRVVRCPGTTNWKTGATASILHRPSNLCDAPHFAYLLGISGPEPVLAAPKPAGTVSSLNPSTLSFIYSGTNGRREGRHRRLYSAARDLYETGFSKEAAYSWLIRGCELTTPRFEEGDDRAIMKVLNQIWR